MIYPCYPTNQNSMSDNLLLITEINRTKISQGCLILGTSLTKNWENL
jgi:hypothetical protein